MLLHTVIMPRKMLIKSCLAGILLTALLYALSSFTSTAHITWTSTAFALSSTQHSALATSDMWSLPGVYPTFVPFTYGRSMLEVTLSSYKTVAWPGLVIIDNSRQREVFRDRAYFTEKYGVHTVIATTASLTFSQLQTTFTWYANQWNVDWYLWSHSDALLVPADAQLGHDYYQQAIDCVTDQQSGQPLSSHVYFGYDLLAAFNTKAFTEVPWDQGIIHYNADCDQYYRLKLANYTTRECRIGTLFNMPAVVNASTSHQLFDPSSTLTHQLKVSLVEQVMAEAKDQAYAWRNSEADATSRMTEADQVGYRLHSEASVKYYQSKYSTDSTCDLQQSWGRPPTFDV